MYLPTSKCSSKKSFVTQSFVVDYNGASTYYALGDAKRKKPPAAVTITLRKFLAANKNKLKSMTIALDGCTNENRNQIFFRALRYLGTQYKVALKIKYPSPNHGANRADRAHRSNKISFHQNK